MTRLVLKDASLLDGDSAARRATVLVEGERIAAVSAGPVETRPGDHIIDLAGKTLMPGTILGHHHAGYWQTGSTGKPVGFEAALKAAIAEGTIKGPRMIAGSRDVSSTGFSADLSFPAWWQLGARTVPRSFERSHPAKALKFWGHLRMGPAERGGQFRRLPDGRCDRRHGMNPPL